MVSACAALHARDAAATPLLHPLCPPLTAPAALFLAWSLSPPVLLRSLGVRYYPSKWWALALPSWCCVAVLCGSLAYEGCGASSPSRLPLSPRSLCFDSLNLLAVAPPDSLSAVTDEAARAGSGEEPTGCVPRAQDEPLAATCRRIFGSSIVT